MSLLGVRNGRRRQSCRSARAVGRTQSAPREGLSAGDLSRRLSSEAAQRLNGVGNVGAETTVMGLFWSSDLYKNSVKEVVGFPFFHAEKQKGEVQRGDVTCLRLPGWKAVGRILGLPLCLADS